MFILGFQEIITLSTKNLLMSSNSINIGSLKKILKKNLETIGKYTMVKTVDLVGIFLIIFVKENLCEYISKIESIIIKTGLMGTMGNKGNCIIRFNFQDVSFAFSCCHLKSGQNETNSRILEISEILNKNIQLKDSKEMLLKDHDVFFVFGDLNFRVNLDFKKCMDYLSKEKFEDYFNNDQFNKNKDTNKDIKLLNEMEIKFPPTYKYLIGSNEYDLKEKRIPSWCDRITFNKSLKIKGIYYDHVDYFKESDHKPIFGIYKVTINNNNNQDINQQIGKYLPENQNYYMKENNNNIGNNTLNLDNFQI